MGSGNLTELAERALAEMRDVLELELAVLYLPRPGPPPHLQRYVASAAETASAQARDEVSFGRRGLAPGGRQRRAAHLPGRRRAGWWRIRSSPGRLVAGAPARLRTSRSDRRRGGATVVARPAAATLLRLLGDPFAAGISTAHLRQSLGWAIERERLRLASEIHDGLAQDLALAMRELSLLESKPSEELAASAERLREAVASAHRVVRARLEDLLVSVPLGGVQAAVEEICERRGRELPLDFVDLRAGR